MSSAINIKQKAYKLLYAKNTHDLSELFKVQQHHLLLISQQKKYQLYQIPKSNGNYRSIEEPEIKLKKIQAILNEHLQCFYYPLKPNSVYGFCIHVSRNDEFNIRSNAYRHIGCKTMINIDLKDFFHTISFQQVHQLFQKHFKKWNAEMLHLLTEICTYNQRLPMGAPTSPVLSNLVCLNLDHELENYAKYSGITFTRYADDFTFSSKKTLSYKDIQYLLSIIHHYGFIENTDKVKLLQSDDIKIVTGIRVLNERLELPEHYIEQINIEIQRQKIEKIFNQYASPNDKLYIQNIDENNFEKMDILGKAPDIDFILHKQKVLYIG